MKSPACAIGEPAVGVARASPAVIIGLQENGLGVVRALAKRGVCCIAVAGTSAHPAQRTLACEEVVRLPAWTGEALVSSLIELGRRLGVRAPLLITQDEAVLWVSAARDRLSNYYHVVLPNARVVDLLMSKAAFHKLAIREGWPVPLTWMVEDRGELEMALDDIVYPCILKPQVKNHAFRRHSPKKAFEIHDCDGLLRTYSMVARWEKEVVIQEWIPGGDDRIAFCLTYCGDDNKPRALFVGRKLRQWPIRCGNTVLSAPAPAEWVEPLGQLSRTIWRRVAYRGLGSIEYKMRPDTDEPVILEPTVGRTNYQNEVAVINGCNIPAAAYYDALGLPYDEPPILRPRRSVKLVDGRSEFRAALSYWREGELTVRNWLRGRAGAKRYVMWRKNDRAPFFAAAAASLRDTLSNMAQLLLGTKLKRRLVKLTRLSR